MFYHEYNRTWREQPHRGHELMRLFDACAMSGGGAVPGQIISVRMSGDLLDSHRLLDGCVDDGYSSHDADLYPIQGGELETGVPIRFL
jgi:hypothetical protein